MLKRPAPTPADIPGLSTHLLSLKAELAGKQLKRLHHIRWFELDLELAQGADSIWLLIRHQGRGGLALRAAYAPGGVTGQVTRKQPGEWGLEAQSAIGKHSVSVLLTGVGQFQITTTLTPAADLLIPYLPRDLYPLDVHDDPAGAVGIVEAAQRGVNGGMLYFRMQTPNFGNVFYFQNLTALNAYFEATSTKPDGVVGGEWPELGYQAPMRLGNSPPTDPLPAGKAVVISDVRLVIAKTCTDEEQGCALQFLDMLAQVYRGLEKPATDLRDWPGRARRTLADLGRSPKATIRHYGHLYVHPYVSAEYPDSMVQSAVLAAVHDYGLWMGRPHPLEAELAAGLDRFFDKELGVIRRYLPNVGEDKNANAVDSWYLYHPLTNLGRMAAEGDARARRLFLDSMDYAIRAARHFRYRWPIQYDVRNFKVLVPSRNAQGLGQTDVGGIYAYVMLQAFEMTGEARFRREAEKALKAGEGLRFEMAYQANLCAWGAVAAVKLWRLNGDDWFRRQSHVYLAGLFHNSEVWESEIERAKTFRNFLGLTCLHDGPYMALYECFESFAALTEYLEVAGEDIAPSVALLASEYNRYSLDRAWFYYPDALPADVLSDKVRNGEIDRKLSFPLEDLYGDGQPCGQVGQEIYGCGAAFIYATRAFHRPKGAPFTVFCDRRVSAIEAGRRSVTVQIGSLPDDATRLIVLRKGGPLPRTLRAETSHGPCTALIATAQRIEFEVPANTGETRLTW
ncbi:MAG: hypothetical protein JWM33_3616 [Caulobacteraceae bacterium]|nr:hypothetical protein [Caulobacteraceae bacterium]